MQAALLVRFSPTTPWRPGSPNGARNSVQLPIGSDTLFAALTLAMRDLGWMEEWLAAATADDGAAVRLSSMFPFGGRHLFIAPPANLWPPEQTGRVRWESARFIPLTLIPALLRDEALSEDRWAADPVSGCLLSVEKFGVVTPPFRYSKRMTAAVDRAGQSSSEAVEMACLQFAPGAGMWFVAQFAEEAASREWRPRVEAACRLLADSGIGGERSSGWGRSEAPGFEEVDLISRFCGSAKPGDGGELGYWLLSLFNPSGKDSVDWRRGNYRIVVRNGRMHGSGALKKPSRMVAEGSVLIAAEPPRGALVDVAPEGAPHASYRSGAAVAIPIPWRETHRLSWLGADRAATEPPPAPPAAVEPEQPAVLPEMETVTEAVAEPVPVESEAVEPQSLPEAVTEPGPIESEPIFNAQKEHAEWADVSGLPGGEPSPDETPDAEPPSEMPPAEPQREEQPTPDETPVEEPPTEIPAEEPPPAQAPREEPPEPDETPVQEPPPAVPPAEPPPAEPPPTGPSAPVEEPPPEMPPAEPPSGPPTPVEEPGPEPPERKPGDDEEGAR